MDIPTYADELFYFMIEINFRDILQNIGEFQYDSKVSILKIALKYPIDIIFQDIDEENEAAEIIPIFSKLYQF